MKKSRYIALSLVFGLFFVSCGNDANDQSSEVPDNNAVETNEVFKLGVTVPLSGDFELFGKVALQGAEYAVAELNAQGGILGQQIELLISDSRSTPEGALEGVQTVLNDGAQAVVGPQSSGEREAVIPLMTEAETPLLYYSVYEGGACDEFIWVFGGDPDAWLRKYVEWVVKEYGNKIYMIGWDYIANTEIAAKLALWMDELGGEIVGTDLVPFSALDFSSVIRKAKASGADAIYNGMYGSALFIETATQLGLKENMHMMAPTVDNIFLKAISKEAGYNLSWSMNWEASDIPIDTPENKKFVEGWKSKFGADSPIGAWAVTVYNSINMYARAAEKAGSFEPRAVRKALAGSQFVGPDGLNVFQGETNHLDLPMRVYRTGDANSSFNIEVVTDLGLSKSARGYCNENWKQGR